MTPLDCPSCGRTDPPGANFCAACGSRLSLDYASRHEQSLAAALYGLPGADTLLLQANPREARPSGKRIIGLLALAIGMGLGVSELVYLLWNHNLQEPERQLQGTLLAESKVPPADSEHCSFESR